MLLVKVLLSMVLVASASRSETSEMALETDIEAETTELSQSNNQTELWEGDPECAKEGVRWIQGEIRAEKHGPDMHYTVCKGLFNEDADPGSACNGVYYSKEDDLYFLCQEVSVRELCVVASYNEARTGGDRAPIKCNPKQNKQVAHYMEQMKATEPSRCKEKLCSMAQKGSWQPSKTKDLSKPWKKSGEDGWERAFKKKCMASHGGVQIFDIGKFLDELSDGNVFKTAACG